MKKTIRCLFFILITAQSAMAVPPPQIIWFDDFQQAISKSKETGKPIFVDCFAEWCVWCHRMEAEVYSDSKFVDFAEKYVMLRINIEDGTEGTRLAANYKVETLPTLLVLDSSEKLINRIGGFLQTDELIADLSKMQDLINKERLNPNDWITVQTLAEEYLFRDMNAEAETRLTRVLQAPIPDTARESTHFSLALSQYYQQKNREALQTLETYLQTYVEGDSTEHVLLLLSQIHLEMDDHEKAKQILQEFVKKFPDSKNAGRARKVLALLEKD